MQQSERKRAVIPFKVTATSRDAYLRLIVLNHRTRKLVCNIHSIFFCVVRAVCVVSGKKNQLPDKLEGWQRRWLKRTPK